MHGDTVSPTVTVHLTAYGLFISNISTSTHLNWLHSGTENNNWQTIKIVFSCHCDPGDNNPIFSQDTPAYDHVPSNQV